MNPASTQSRSQIQNPLEAVEILHELEPQGNDTVSHSAQDRENITKDWDSFYKLTSENISAVVNENAVRRIEIQETQIETSFSKPKHESELFKPDFKPVFEVEKQSGGSLLEETGIVPDLKNKVKSFAKSLLGVFSLFGEIFMDTITLVTGRKEKKGKKQEKIETDPAKAKAAAEKKAENMRKQGNIKAFYDGLRSQSASVVTVEAVRVETQEKANINKTVKMQESYKGIKDSFGRMTVYAASMFEKAQLDEEKKIKKQEKEMKIAAVKGPDLNMDKVAEGGYLSSTGGQGAG